MMNSHFVRPIWPSLLTLIIFFPVPASAEDDVVYTGNALTHLRTAVHVGHIRLRSKWLTLELSQTSDSSLALLLIPAIANAEMPKVRKVSNNGATYLTDRAVDPEDIDVLRRSAANISIVGYLLKHESQLKDPMKWEAIKDSIDERINGLPEEQRPLATAYAGAIFAEQGIVSPLFEPLILEYRETRLQDVKNELMSPEFVARIQSGVPYTFGPGLVDESTLAKIPADRVTDLNVGLSQYKIAWVGAKLVVVKPLSALPIKPAYTALDKLRVKDAIKNQISDADKAFDKPSQSIQKLDISRE